MVRVCFVCLGNICRSPTAEGVMAHLLKEEGIQGIEIDSAGTSAHHIGESPDRRSTATARKRGIRLSGSSRQFVKPDFKRFDYVVAMDASNRSRLMALAPDEHARAKISLLRDFDPDSPPDSEVPDPYYGGAQGFETVVDICLAGCRGLLDHLRREHGLD